MNLGRLNHGDLLKEKNLWQLFKASQSIPDSRFNWIIGCSVFVLFAVYSVGEHETLRIHSLLLKLAELGIDTAISLLGFLIAGFTIFASLAKPQLLLTMLKHKHRETGLSYLKYNFFTLVRVFVYFLAFSAFQLLVVALGQPDGVMSAFTAKVSAGDNVLYWGNRCMLAFSAAFWAFVFLQLKSFVFNVYHFVMTMIKFDAVEHNDRLKNENESKEAAE